MRNLKVSILALSVMAGGMLAASAFYDVAGKDYPFNPRFVLPTNIVEVYGMPRIVTTDLITGFPAFQGGAGDIFTDGAGKINGVQYMTLYLGTLTTQTNDYLSFIMDVSGNCSTKGTGPAVKMQMKGNGYSRTGNALYGTGPQANITFTSSGALIPHTAERLSWTNQTVLANWFGPGPGDDAAVIIWTEKYYYSAQTYTYTNMITFDIGLLDLPPGTPFPQANWNTDPAVVFVDNSAYADLPGTASGNYKTTTKTSIKINKAPAVLSGVTELWSMSSGNFVLSFHGNGGLAVFHLDDYTSGQVINPGTKLYSAGDFFSGKGTTSTKKLPGTYKLNLKGAAWGQKSSLNMNGNLGDLIVDYVRITNATAIVVPYYTNSVDKVYYITNTTSGITRYENSWGSLRITNPVYQTNIVALGIRTIASASGKVVGQKITKAVGVNEGAEFFQVNNGTVFVPQPPEALFVAAPTTVDAQANVVFDNNSTGDNIGYLWLFGDGSAPSTSFSPVHAYALAGVYTVTLNARGPNETNTLVRPNYITVNPVASFTAANAPAPAVNTIIFTDMSVGEVVGDTTWAWTFGDPLNGTSTQQSPTYAYAAPGVYNVTLTVTSAGRVDSVTVQVTVPIP